MVAPRRVSEWSGDHEPSALRLKSLHAKCSDASVGGDGESVGCCGGIGVAGDEVCADALNDAVATTTDNENCETSFEDTGVLLAGC
jgi:hypothetical protein